LWKTAKKEPESTFGKFWTKLKNQALNYLVGVNVTDASKQIDLETSEKYAERTIQISDLDYSTFKFKLDKSDKDKLEDSGYKATKEWVSNYYQDDVAVEIEIESRKDWNDFCSFNELTPDELTQITNKYNSVLSKLK
jgi:hypothetical protein